MPNWDKKFKAEYDYARTFLANPQNFHQDWQPLVRSLHELMSGTGFDATRASALSELRYKCRTAVKDGKNGEDKPILEAVNAWTEKEETVEPRKKMRAAALKMLRHTYLLTAAGSKKTWVHSLPVDFLDWSSDHFNDKASTGGAVKTLLRSKTEQFTEDQKKFLSNSTLEALAWSQKTQILLGAAANKSEADKQAAARAVVKRWFADATTTEAQLDSTIGTLHKGFKAITATLNKGHFILTDWVPLRGATDAAEVKWRNAEAFTFRSGAEGLDVVYIENSFFKDSKGNVLKGQKNWTRIIIHELTHLVCGTKDVNTGQARYAWYGIGPNANFKGTQAAENADSWAFFSADCSGQLTDGERATALRIR